MCLLPLIAGVCLFTPANLTVDASASWAAFGMHDYRLAGEHYGGSIGRVSIDMRVPITQTITLRYGLEHTSYIETNRDRGEERAVLGLTWRPFSTR